MKIKGKLLSSFGGIALLTLLLGLVSWIGITNVGNNYKNFTETNVPAIMYIEKATMEFTQIKANIRSLLNPLNSDEDIKRQFDNMERNRADYKKAMELFQAIPKVPEEERLFKEMQEKIKLAADNNNQTLELARQLLQEKANKAEIYQRMNEITMVKGRTLIDEAIAAAIKLIDFDMQHYAKDEVKKDLESISKIQFSIVITILICLLAAILLGVIISGRISKPLTQVAHIANDVSAGNLNIEKLKINTKDEIAELANAFNKMIDVISLVAADTINLSKAAVEGKLQTRADASKHQGEFRKIVEGINETLDNVTKPVNRAMEILEKMALGDLTDRIKEEYKGDYDRLKGSLNSSLNSINEILGQVNTAIGQVAAGANQVSQASQSLSQGAAEQASSLEEITSSLTEINSQTKQNTDIVIQVNGLAQNSRENAAKGNEQMKGLVSSMADINKSSEDIKKIVKTIDDIAFQINLLALNANVEAARAGKYGKGFAVVAEEVRNLAVRSAGAVKETTMMVEESIKNIEKGNNFVQLTAKQLEEIFNGSAKVADLAEEVTTASKEQAKGLEQVNIGLSQIDQVTQSNTASAEESASASEELASQAQQLKSTIAKFKLNLESVMKAGPETAISPEILQMIREEMNKRESHLAHLGTQGANKTQTVKKEKTTLHNEPKHIIKLEDEDFGKF